MNKLEMYGSLLVSFDFSKGKDTGVLLVGVKKSKQNIEIINAFQGEEAIDLFKRLTTVKNKQ